MATGEGYGKCSFCGRDGAWTCADTQTYICEESCDCGFCCAVGPDKSSYKFGKWMINVDKDGKGALLLDGVEIANEKEIAELLEFLLKIFPAKLLKDNILVQLRQKYLDETGFMQH